jgi:hypothetical protein
MINIRQYKELNEIKDENNYTYLASKILGLNPSIHTKQEVEDYITKHTGNITPNQDDIKKLTNIKLGKNKYKIQKDLKKVTFTQFIKLDEYMKGNPINDLEKIISLFLLPYEGKIFKTPSKFDPDKTEDIEKDVLDKLDLDIALSFFFSLTKNIEQYTKNITIYTHNLFHQEFQSNLSTKTK